MPAVSDQFIQYWDNEVKPLADKCCEGAALLGQFEEAKTEAEKEAIKKQMNSFGKKDWFAPWYISQMVFYVEHDLADDRNPGIRMLQVRDCLASEDYYKNVFKGQDCEEMRNYRELGQKMDAALKMLV